jgi:hypothetical protein
MHTDVLQKGLQGRCLQIFADGPQDLLRAGAVLAVRRSRARSSSAMQRPTRVACTSRSRRRRPTGNAPPSSCQGRACPGSASSSTIMPSPTPRECSIAAAAHSPCRASKAAQAATPTMCTWASHACEAGMASPRSFICSGLSRRLLSGLLLQACDGEGVPRGQQGVLLVHRLQPLGPLPAHLREWRRVRPPAAARLLAFRQAPWGVLSQACSSSGAATGPCWWLSRAGGSASGVDCVLHVIPWQAQGAQPHHGAGGRRECRGLDGLPRRARTH